jgi:GTP cyclohydrolase I
MSRKRQATSGKHRGAVERAFAELLRALGVERDEVSGTPRRAAALWIEQLTAGEGVELGELLGRGIKHRGRTPVILTHIGIHLVCPHHLTVAFGEAHVGYVPAGRIVGFGALSRVAEAACARLVLQETAAHDIAVAVHEQLGAEAAVVMLEAVHPCHNLKHPRSQKAEVVTWAAAGDERSAARLERLLAAELS